MNSENKRHNRCEMKLKNLSYTKMKCELKNKNHYKLDKTKCELKNKKYKLCENKKVKSN